MVSTAETKWVRWDRSKMRSSKIDIERAQRLGMMRRGEMNISAINPMMKLTAIEPEDRTIST
jgi:hypothetical protein